MADIQKQFEKFHETIRVDFDMSADLREKRDILVGKIKKYLADNDLPGIRVLHQGSYKMKTGVKPIEEMEYDIDVGLRFDISEDDFTAPDVRSWVLDAVQGHTKEIQDKGPCIRVLYQKGFHVDLVCYAVWDEDGEDTYRLAHKTQGWRPTDPPALLQYVDRYRESFSDTEDGNTKTDQFRRIVRCLRRWIDVRKPHEDKSKPSGLGIVLLAIQHELQPLTFLDGRSNDRGSLNGLISTLTSTVGRLVAHKPTPENEDVLQNISDPDMVQLKAWLSELDDALRFAGTTVDPVWACERLQLEFGPDFPVPDPDETGKKTTSAAIITSSSSA